MYQDLPAPQSVKGNTQLFFNKSQYDSFFYPTCIIKVDNDGVHHQRGNNNRGSFDQLTRYARQKAREQIWRDYMTMISVTATIAIFEGLSQVGRCNITSGQTRRNGPVYTHAHTAAMTMKTPRHAKVTTSEAFRCRRAAACENITRNTRRGTIPDDDS